jgi:hypothetical protein
MDAMKKFLLAFIAAMIAASIAMFLIPGCCSFKPVWVKELPPECNMSLNAMSLYYQAEDKSGAVPGMEACFSSLRKQKCQADVFGFDDKGKMKSVDYSDTIKYRNYSECQKELR